MGNTDITQLHKQDLNNARLIIQNLMNEPNQHRTYAMLRIYLILENTSLIVDMLAKRAINRHLTVLCKRFSLK